MFYTPKEGNKDLWLLHMGWQSDPPPPSFQGVSGLANNWNAFAVFYIVRAEV